MGSFYSSEHITEDCIHIAAFNIEVSQLKYALKRSVIDYYREKGLTCFLDPNLTLALSFFSGMKHLVRMKVSYTINELTLLCFN